MLTQISTDVDFGLRMATKVIRVSDACDALVDRLASEQRRTKSAVVELAVECLAGMRSGTPPRMELADRVPPGLDSIHGLHASVGVDEDRTWRSQEEGGYLGISRETVPEPEKNRIVPATATPSPALVKALKTLSELPVESFTGLKHEGEPVTADPYRPCADSVQSDPSELRVELDAEEPPRDDFNQVRRRGRGI